MHDHLGDFEGCEVRETQLDEFALLVQLIELLQCLLEGHASVGGVEVKDIDAVGSELFEGLVQLLLDHVGFVGAGSMRVPLCGTSETALLPFGLAGEGFLLAADVDAGCVDFIVASALEAVENLVVVVDVSDAGAFRLVGTKGPALSC